MSTYNLLLEAADVFQILDALESRTTAYENTAASFSGDYDDDYDMFIPEECSTAEEATQIAQHFRDIIATINSQIQAVRA